MLKMQTFLRNRDDQVCRYGNPDLRLHGVLACSKEHLDTQMLLDPLEEQLHLSALAIQIGNQLRRERQVVGQKHQALALVVLGHHPAQHRRVIFARLVVCQHTRLIANHGCAFPVYWMRVTPFELCIALGAGHKEGFGLVNHEQTGKVHGKELIQAREVLDFVFSPVICHTATIRAQRQKSHELRKYELALVHDGLRRKSAKNPKSDLGRPNRDQTETLNWTSKSISTSFANAKAKRRQYKRTASEADKVHG